MTNQAYNVPIILPDLRKEESYHQLVDALEYLDAVSNDVFNRITCRVVENRDQLTAINRRILTAQAKIDKLRSASTKAARVFSSPKYPAPDSITHYHTIYQDVNPMLQKVRKTKAQIDSRLPEVNKETLKQKSKLVPLFLERRRSNRSRSQVDEEMTEGLGSLPRYIPSVSSLLLFNTAENPYKKYVLLDPLEGAKTKTRDKIIEEEKELSEAPITITQGEELGRAQQDSIMYVPLMPELSQLDVPEMLPQLQYVASDVFYSADVGASIAPSLANAAVPDLPNLADPNAPAQTAAPPSAAPSSSEPPPPPPSDAAPPPPPPPPPPVQAPPLPTVGDQSGESSDEEGGAAAQPPADPGDGRANLMEAIRKAGGASKAGLKDAKAKKHKRKAKKEEVMESSPGDLLGDLTAALGRRRKAMSGKDKGKDQQKEERKEEHNLGGGSMMDNISKMIPAPPGGGGGGGDQSGSEGGDSDEGAW